MLHIKLEQKQCCVQTKSILQVGKDLGNLRINFHGEELNYLGSVEVRYPNIFVSTIIIRFHILFLPSFTFQH